MPIQKILIDIVPAKGHIHATLKMANILKDAGYEIYYALPAEYRLDVEKKGFFCTEEVQLPFSRREIGLQSQIAGIGNFDELGEIKKILECLNPCLIMLDEQNSFKAIYYRILNFPVVFFLSKPDTARHKGVPPFTTYTLPANSCLKHIYINSLWAVRLLRIRSSLLLLKIKTRGEDKFSICANIAKKHGIKFHDQLELQRSFGIGIRGIPRLIISPKAFDFPRVEKENVFRIGPLVNVNREGKIDHPRYFSLIQRIEKIKNTKNGMVIYASMGTVSRYDLKRCTKFFIRIANVARMNPDDLFVISTGKYFDVNLLLPLPDNVIVFESVPQVDLLQKCDVMVTHGGMNSITECVFCGVPMLVYPLSKNWDQPGNSARVVYHQLGLRGRIECDSDKTISRKLNQLKVTHSVYKQNVLQMRTKFEIENNSTQIVTIVESIIRNHEYERKSESY